MAKHARKIQKGLDARINAFVNAGGNRKPGSQNQKKTGYGKSGRR